MWSWDIALLMENHMNYVLIIWIMTRLINEPICSSSFTSKQVVVFYMLDFFFCGVKWTNMDFIFSYDVFILGCLFNILITCFVFHEEQLLQPINTLIIKWGWILGCCFSTLYWMTEELQELQVKNTHISCLYSHVFLPQY